MNKTVFVTGGSQGIGAAVVEKFAKEGYNATFSYFGEAAKEEADKFAADLTAKYGVESKAYPLSIGENESVVECVKALHADYPQIDCLVNNAGITKDMLSLRMKEEDFRQVLDINLVGSFNMTQAIIRKMSRHGGSIVNVSSIIGVIGNAGQVNYAASKAGLIGVTKSYAKEYGRKNVRVNAVAPGFINTAMTDKLAPELKEEMIKHVSLNRMGEAEEVAKAIYFLGSEEASYITGQVLLIDGQMA
jgi:3-oxoacyl-[acyl-carrier protein] reductase